MKKLILFLAFLCLFQLHLKAETAKTETPIPQLVFHNIGWNALNSITYNYGANFIGAGLGTWGMIESGLDWKWRNVAFDNRWMSNIGAPVMVIGVIVPALTPLAFYFPGKHLDDERLVITAGALTQSLILTLGIQSPLKMISGRRNPGLSNSAFGGKIYERVYDEDDFSGEFDWFNMDFFNGWPSGHTANAFSAAATIAEIYHDKPWVKIAAYTYASIIGFGTTTHAHWASEAFAGALIGYAIGKTVGKSYRQLLEKSEDDNTISFYCTMNSAGIIIRPKNKSLYSVTPP